MISFKTTLHKFEQKGEKTRWTYIEIPFEIANQIKPDCKKGYRVKGKIDALVLKMVALLPMGEGDFIIPINGGMRKVIKKEAGASVEVSLEEDTDEFILSPDMMACLEEEPSALAAFQKLPGSHQKYYSKWVDSAKTVETKSKRIRMVLMGFAMGMDFGEMVRYYKNLE